MTLDDLKEWGMYLLECINQIEPNKPDEELIRKVVFSIEEKLSYFHSKIDVKTVNHIVHEIELCALRLDPSDLNSINKKMVKRFGSAIGDKTFFKRIERVINGKEIKNAAQYRLLSEYLDLFSDDVSKMTTTQKAIDLVNSFEAKLNRK